MEIESSDPEPGSGVRNVLLFYSVDDDDPVQYGDGPLGTTSGTVYFEIPDDLQNEQGHYYLYVIAEDYCGNLEPKDPNTDEPDCG